jgi:hypothetical protein
MRAVGPSSYHIAPRTPETRCGDCVRSKEKGAANGSAPQKSLMVKVR